MNKLPNAVGPDGQMLRRTVTESRKLARRSFAEENGFKWGDLWKMGYRVRVAKVSEA